MARRAHLSIAPPPIVVILEIKYPLLFLVALARRLYRHRLAVLAADGSISSCKVAEVEWRHGLAADRDLQCGVGLVCDACTRRLRRCHVDLEGLVTELAKLAVALRYHEDAVIVEEDGSKG